MKSLHPALAKQVALALATMLPLTAAFAGADDHTEAPAAPLRTASVDHAPKGTGFALARQVIAGGGGSSSGGAFAVSGTIGQADADPLHPATGGAYAITGGFWAGIAPAPPQGDPVFANGFEALPP